MGAVERLPLQWEGGETPGTPGSGAVQGSEDQLLPAPHHV